MRISSQVADVGDKPKSEIALIGAPKSGNSADQRRGKGRATCVNRRREKNRATYISRRREKKRANFPINDGAFKAGRLGAVDGAKTSGG